MGQNPPVPPQPPVSALTTTSPITRKITPAIRQSLHPLYYIPPKVYIFDQPSVTMWAEDRGKFLGHGPIKVNESQGDSEDNGEELAESNLGNGQQEIIYKKIEVKWNKFIKMKRKSFLLDYDVIRQIGSGGFGCVYKVIMKNGNIFRAAKRIHKKSLKPDEHQNLLAEMAIMMHMDHPNITRLYQVYDDKNSYVLILELCEGGELFDRIVEQSITETDAKKIIRQILSALNYMHSKGIVHRDIKPENMLFEKSTHLVKIIDFGISAKLEPNATLSCRVAPEVLSKNYNEKCDIWSLGVVLYMMIYNFPPFKGSTPLDVMKCITRDEISYRNPLSFNYSYLAIDFLKCLLSRNLAKRPSANQALHHRWLSQNPIDLQEGDQEEKDKILERMTKFHFKNKLEAVVYTYIVSQLLSSEERLELLGTFRQLDKNSNGIIQVNQLKSALTNKKYFQVSDEKVKLIKDYLDTNCSGFIDYTEFLVAGLDFQKKIEQKHFDQAFSYFDIDNSGEITFEEVCKFLENEIATQEEIRELFRQVDRNGDGVISRVEFIGLLAQKKLEKYR